MAHLLFSAAGLGFGVFPDDSPPAPQCSAPTSEQFSSLVPSICIYDSMPSMDQLQADLAATNEPTLAALEAALDTNPATIVYSSAEITYTPEDDDEASRLAANFATAQEHIMLKGYWSSPLVRASYDAPMARGEVIAFAGYPNRAILEVAEMSILHIAEATSEAGNHLRLKMLTGKQSLVVDGYYDYELTLSGTTGAATCKSTKAGVISPHLSEVGRAVLNNEVLKTNNDDAVVRYCNDALAFLKSDGACVASDSCFFSSADH